ncbi:glycosyltransferase family 9 protein [Sansalvadorimonas verongulae]|uniref:glycosyltransferase family 9 protein n=1 Tax=Sansalvadorimonas verongulae TaxID=2172824 RepID=UPI002E33DF7B|nr:glycosyltransferase family 9 protein [Sansalvadorimonas verongulae]MTI15181.1 glycosyltransferase family 9 protein [Sansalvadorimonas verongulae]
MKVDTMRWVDRYIGVPLCYLLKLIFWPFDWLQRNKTTNSRNVLFIELSEMGSAILADPSMRWLKEQGKTLHFVIFEKNAASLKLLNTIDRENIFLIKADTFFSLAISSLQFLIWCRKKKIDTVIDLELFSRVTSILSRLSGADNRVGFDRVHEEGLYRGNYLTHPVMYNPHRHISKNFMTLVQASLKSPHQPYQKNINEEPIKLARAEINPDLRMSVIRKIKTLYSDYQPDKQRLVLINPNASDLLPQRRWMKDRYVKVIQALLAEYSDILVVITGAPSERPEADILKMQVSHGRCVNSAGVFEFNELVPLYSISEIMLSNDSGPPHFASVTDLKTFVIFGPETPALYGALGNSTPIYANLPCSPCVSAGNHRKTSCTDNQCLKAIDVQQVLNTLRPALSSTRTVEEKLILQTY